MYQRILVKVLSRSNHIEIEVIILIPFLVNIECLQGRVSCECLLVMICYLVFTCVVGIICSGYLNNYSLQGYCNVKILFSLVILGSSLVVVSSMRVSNVSLMSFNYSYCTSSNIFIQLCYAYLNTYYLIMLLTFECANIMFIFK